MTAQEIMQMGDEEIIAFHSNLPPIRAKRMDWRKIPALEQRRSTTAPELPLLPPVEEMFPATEPQRTGQGTPQFVNPDLIH